MAHLLPRGCGLRVSIARPGKRRVLMRKAITYVAGAGVAGVIAMAATPSHALVANGTFGFAINGGEITVDTTDITAATSTKTLPATLQVNTVPANFLGNPNNLPVAVNDPVTLS